MPLSPNAASALRGVHEPALYQDESDRRYARALAWLGHTVCLKLRFGIEVVGTVEGVASIPNLKLRSMDSGVVLLRRGGAAVDVLEGYILGTVVDITEAPGRPAPVGDRDRRDRF